VRGSLPLAWKFDTASWFFLAEIVIGGVVPMVMLFFESIRWRPLGLFAAQLLVVLGMIFNRMNVAVTAFQLGTGAAYTPHWMEFVVSIGVVAIGFFLFGLAVRYLPVFEEGPLEKARPVDLFAEMTGR
jgi:Ni/Fe-hydrogenase subunit HybB-like protein